MSVAAIVKTRGIAEILHFTTNKGLTGMFATGSIKSRELLPAEQTVEYILHNNCAKRTDTDWIGYVNLSISRINSGFFEIASKKWHAANDVWWCILSLEPSLVNDSGVHFATTNNFYSGVKRAPGPAGLEALFAPRIHQFKDKYATRPEAHPSNQPTCAQAEVLYPAEVPLSFVRKIYVATAEHSDSVSGLFGIYPELGQGVEIIVCPKAFE